jgi:hypothetical protein
LIGANLIQQSTTEVAFLLTDHEYLLAQRKGSSCPLLWVAGRRAAAEPGNPSSTWDLRCHAEFPGDLAAFERWLQQANPGLDLSEPFARVWEALAEILGKTEKPAAA